MTAREALEFLANRVERQSAAENVPLSRAERSMLRWSEVEPDAFCDFRAGEEFEQQYDSEEYEAKITGLLKRAYEQDRSDRTQRQRWKDAETALAGHDYYLLVMANSVFS